jgi:hypothetical protein
MFNLFDDTLTDTTQIEQLNERVNQELSLIISKSKQHITDLESQNAEKSASKSPQSDQDRHFHRYDNNNRYYPKNSSYKYKEFFC